MSTALEGTAPRPPSEPSEPATGTDTITITLSSTTGAPGDEIDVTVDSDPSTVVVIDSGDLDGDDFSRLWNDAVRYCNLTSGRERGV